MKARPRIYEPGQYGLGDQLELSENASLHVAVVLRLQVEQEILLFSGDDHEYTARLVRVHKKKVQVQIVDVRYLSRESSQTIHLLQGVSKGHRMEMVIQKAVELGVYSIRPILTAHCAVRTKKVELEKKQQQWQAIVISACEQSGRNRVPTVYQPVTLTAYLQDRIPCQHFFLAMDSPKRWRDYQFDRETALLVGPEGGFSADELSLFHEAGYHALSLGPRILRTETAGIAGLVLLQGLGGDF